MIRWPLFKPVAGYVLFPFLCTMYLEALYIAFLLQCGTGQRPWPEMPGIVLQAFLAAYLLLFPFVLTGLVMRYARTGGAAQAERHPFIVKFFIGVMLALAGLGCFSFLISSLITFVPRLFDTGSYVNVLFSGGPGIFLTLLGVVGAGLMAAGLWAGNPVPYVIIFLGTLSFLFTAASGLLATFHFSLPHGAVFGALTLIGAAILYGLLTPRTRAFFFPELNPGDARGGGAGDPRSIFRKAWLYFLPLLIVLGSFLVSGIFCFFGYQPIEELMPNAEGWPLTPWQLFGVTAGLFALFTLLATAGAARLLRSGISRHADNHPWWLKLLLGSLLWALVTGAVYMTMFFMFGPPSNA